METFLIGTSYAIQYILLVLFLYWLFIGFFGLSKPKKLKEHKPEKKFLILVPAHNEENVIGALVDNLTKLDYPKELYDVFIIADNCTDNTAKIAISGGVGVIEHTSKPGELKGKPYGIKYALEQFENLSKQYDAIAFFDADNLVSTNYLKEMNNHLLNGDRLIQCYLDTKNPNDNWITLSYATSYYYMNRSWQLGKSKLGLGNAIGGTGFCVDSKLMEEVGWNAHSLTEDLEFTMQCLLKGIPARWSHHARIYDEKPEGMKASMVQRLRWARGHWDVCFKYTPKLLWRFITKLDMKALDGALYLLNPAKIVVDFSMLIIVLVALFTAFDFIEPIFPWWVWVSMFVYQLIYVYISIRLDAKEKVNVIKAYFSLLIFNATYLPLFFWSLITVNNKTWKRTEHKRAIKLEEVN